MLNKELIKSICEIYGISKVGLKENNDYIDLIIFQMDKNISLEKWNYFESILKEFTKKDVCVIDAVQAKKYLSNEYLEKGIVML